MTNRFCIAGLISAKFEEIAGFKKGLVIVLSKFKSTRWFGLIDDKFARLEELANRTPLASEVG